MTKKGFHCLAATLTWVLLFGCLPLIKAQQAGELVFQGDELFNEGDYYGASLYYYKAVKMDSTRWKTVKKYADACRLSYNYAEAARWYARLAEAEEKEKKGESGFWHAMMVKSTGDYLQAEKLFRDFASQSGAGESLQKRAATEAEACNWAGKAVEEPLPVRLTRLGNTINTPYSEFGAQQLGDSLLLFSSLQPAFTGDLTAFEPSGYLAALFQARLTRAGPANTAALPEKLNDPLWHNANMVAAGDGQTYYFTRCETVRKPDIRCEIYQVRTRNGKWQRPVKLPETINVPGYTATHPAIAHMPNEDILFFVSDRPGGLGGKDIWYSVVRKGKVQEPSNLGSLINTPGDEITPFYHGPDGTLYFSSDRHRGFGGFDIFRSAGSYNQWSLPENAGTPLNSSANDLYFTINRDDSSGYLTSNRPGSLFISTQTCCNDIYHYRLVKPPPAPDTLPQNTDTVSRTARIRSLLPLTLYFHNDEPDPATTKETTTVNYRTSVADYLLLQPKYMEEYVRGLKGEEIPEAREEIGGFFEDYVLKGLNQLDTVTSLMLEELRRGSSITLTVKGFTSPLNSAEYNKNLARRRIQSLINYFRETRDGVLLPYLADQPGSGVRLRILEVPVGEEQASKLVSDNPQDKRNSVYSRAAALERRIQVLFYEVNP